MLSDAQTLIQASATSAIRDGADAAGTATHRDFLSRVLLAGIVVLAAVVRFWALDFGLPHTQARPDETFIIDVALKLLRGEFWPRFYDYPRLYPYAVTLLYLGYYVWGVLTERFLTLAEMVASWPTYWAPFFLLSRCLSAAAGTLTVVVVHGIGKRLAGRGAGLIAALFTSLAFIHVRDSHFGTTDVAMTLLAVWSVSWLLRGGEHQAGRYGVLAAISAGLATATKYSGVFLLVPLGLSQVLGATLQERRRTFPMLAWSSAALGGSFVLALFIGVPFVVFDYQRFSVAMSELAANLIVGVAPHVILPNGWWYHLSRSLRYGMGLPVLGLGLMGWAVIAARDWRRALLLLSYPITYFAVAGSANTLYTRYAVPVVPFLCIGAAVAVVEGTRVLTRRSRFARLIVAALVATTVVAPSAWSVVRFNQVMGEIDNRVLVTEWVKQHVPRGSSIAQSGSQYGHVQLSRDHGLHAWIWDKKERMFVEGGRTTEGRPDWILLQQSPLPSDNQEVVLEWLKTGYQLNAVFVAFDAGAPGNVYDLHDMFYVPLAGFAGVRRPGPNFYVYRRAEALAGGVSRRP